MLFVYCLSHTCSDIHETLLGRIPPPHGCPSLTSCHFLGLFLILANSFTSHFAVHATLYTPDWHVVLTLTLCRVGDSVPPLLRHLIERSQDLKGARVTGVIVDRTVLWSIGIRGWRRGRRAWRWRCVLEAAMMPCWLLTRVSRQ